jgi:predicted ester cyclase
VVRGSCAARTPRNRASTWSRPTTGRTIEYVSHEFYRIADGLIAEEWICSDMATLLGQLS